jgi:hypothetical protein
MMFVQIDCQLVSQLFIASHGVLEKALLEAAR